jgi:hypothetical protein
MPDPRTILETIQAEPQERGVQPRAGGPGACRRPRSRQGDNRGLGEAPGGNGGGGMTDASLLGPMVSQRTRKAIPRPSFHSHSPTTAH